MKLKSIWEAKLERAEGIVSELEIGEKLEV